MADAERPGFLVTDIHVDFHEPTPGVLRLLGVLRPDWDPALLRTENLEGGVVNLMLCCHLVTDAAKSDAIVVRCYRSHADGAGLSRDKEFQVMQIAHVAGCFPAILATLENGVAYRYAPGRMLDMTDILDPDVIRIISRKLADFHMVDVDKVPLVDMRGNRIEAFDKSAWFFKRVHSNQDNIPDKIDSSELRNKRYQKHRWSREAVSIEVELMKTTMNTMDLPTCLCHNDFHLYNIIYDEKSKDVVFVDYEMSDYQVPVMDLVYLFGQRPLIEDIGRVPPETPQFTEEARLLFLRYYLERRFENQGKEPDDITDQDFKLFDLEQRLLYPFFFLHFIILSHLMADKTWLPIDLFALVPRFTRIYHGLKPDIPRLLHEYTDLKSTLSKQNPTDARKGNGEVCASR